MAKCPACDYPYAKKGYYHTEGIVGVKKNVLQCTNCGYEEESGPCFIATTVYGNYESSLKILKMKKRMMFLIEEFYHQTIKFLLEMGRNVGSYI